MNFKEYHDQVILTEAEQFLIENLTKIFGELGNDIKAYFMCKKDPRNSEQYKCPDRDDLLRKIVEWMKIERNNPASVLIVDAVRRIYKMSHNIDEFLANLKAELSYNYKKYGLD